MKKKCILWVIVVLLIMLSLAIGSNRQFSLFGLFQGQHKSWELFWESRLPRTLAIILASSAISLSGLLMQTISQNPYAAPSTTGTTEAAQLGILSSLFFFGKATLFQKMSFAFISSLLFTSLFIQVIRRLKFKEKWVLPLVGLIYSGIIGSFAETIAFRFNLTQSMTSWNQGSFSMIQRHQYEWLFLLVFVLLVVRWYSNTFSIMALGEDTSRTLGLSYQTMETLALVLVSLTSAITMITVGALPFLGVIVPNLVRQFAGDFFKNTRSLVMLVGMILVLACDIVARLVIWPYEVSVSLILGVIGTLVFLMLIWKRCMTMIKRSTLILLLILACLGFLATSYYLFPTASVPNSYILNLRVKKLLVYLLVALISSFTTVSFQAVTGNRFLTPSVLGLESFYVLMQSLFLAIFWRWSQGVAPRSMTEFLIVMSLQCAFFLSLLPMIKKLLGKGIRLILLICMTLGTLFRSLSTFLQVVMAPNEYDKLQSKLFASLQNVNQEVLYLAVGITFVLCSFLYRKGRVLDIFYLGKDNARLLGINVEKEQTQILWFVVILVATSTALVGPLSYLGFILANLTYQMVKDFRHQTLFIVGSLLGYVMLLVVQTLVERVFNFSISVRTMIELGGGLFFFYLLYKERRKL